MISSDVDPSSGKRKGRKHEIYRSRLGLTDKLGGVHYLERDIRWEPITWNSRASNLRPIIVRDGSRRIVLWNRGVYNNYTNYQLDAVGFVESVDDDSPIARPFSQEGMLKAMKLAKDFQERGGVLRQGWIDGTFYGGVFACYEATGNEAFLNSARKWTRSPFSTNHALNGDAICSAQTYIDVYMVDKDEKLIAPIKRFSRLNILESM